MFCQNGGAAFTVPDEAGQSALPEGDASDRFIPAPTVDDPRRIAARSPLFLSAVILLTVGSCGSFMKLLFDVLRFCALYGFRFEKSAVYGCTVYFLTFISLCVSAALCAAIWLVFIKSKKKTDPLPVGGALSIIRAMIIVSVAAEVLLPAVKYTVRFFAYDFWKTGDILGLMAQEYLWSLASVVSFVFAAICVGAIKKAKTNAAVVVSAILCFIFVLVYLIKEIGVFTAMLRYDSLKESIIYEIPGTVCGLIGGAAAIIFGILLLKYHNAARTAKQYNN